jgi:hypothetical protein
MRVACAAILSPFLSVPSFHLDRAREQDVILQVNVLMNPYRDRAATRRLGDKDLLSSAELCEKAQPLPLLVVALFCAQPEHAICKSYTTGATKNYRSPGDSKRPAKVRMTIDEDSRNPETDPQNHA